METYTVVTDAGVDDIIALLLLAKLSPAQNHTIVSTFGNAPEEYTSQNTREFIAFATPRWNYTHGSKNPLKPLEHPWPSYFHGPDGVCGVHPNINHLSNVQNSKIALRNERIISLGPMTDVYKILKKSKGIKEVIVMGGAINVPGNETKYAETNIAFDPDAAASFFENCDGIDIKVVPIDVTKKVFWTKDKVIQIPENKEYGAWIKRLLLTWFENYGGKREQVFHLHDPLAVYSIYYPNDLEWQLSGVKVITEGERRGQMALSQDKQPVEIASAVRNEKISDKIFELIFGY